MWIGDALSDSTTQEFSAIHFGILDVVGDVDWVKFTIWSRFCAINSDCDGRGVGVNWNDRYSIVGWLYDNEIFIFMDTFYFWHVIVLNFGSISKIPI